MSSGSQHIGILGPLPPEFLDLLEPRRIGDLGLRVISAIAVPPSGMVFQVAWRQGPKLVARTWKPKIAWRLQQHGSLPL